MALIPLLIAFGGSFLFQLGLGFNSSLTAICAQGLAAIFVYTGAGMTALTIFAPSIGATLIANSAAPGVIHRLAMAAGTTFDSTPWSMAVLLNFQVMDVKLKEGYGRVVMVQVVITTIYTLVGLLAALILH